MIDLHTHTLFSDGVLGPAELMQRAKNAGYRTIAFTDHVDNSNYDIIAPHLARFCQEMEDSSITVIAGVELTHVPPKMIANLVVKCRDLGATIVLVHGETIIEPVEPGTNRAAIEAGVDILAHPGLISTEDAKEAADRGVALEISGRGGHSFANGHVVSVARETGAKLIFSTDAHQPRDLMSRDMAITVSQAAGMNSQEIDKMFANANDLVVRAKKGSEK